MSRTLAAVTAVTLLAGFWALAPSPAAAAIKYSEKVWLGGNAEVWLEWNTTQKRAAGKLASPQFGSPWWAEGRVAVQRYVTPEKNTNEADTGRVRPLTSPLSTSGTSYVPGRWYRACAWIWRSYIAGPACTVWVAPM